jgi:hypothetical protein
MSAASSRRRFLSVWLRRLATDRIARRSGAPPEQAPFVIVHPVKNALALAAVNDAAARLGLAIGMALADARAMYPALTVADAEPEADRRLLEAIADWCDRYTPLIGLDPPDGLVLDITGCAHLFGGEAALGRDIVRRLGQQGLAARAAIADTAGCAWAVARYGAPLHPPLPKSDLSDFGHVSCRSRASPTSGGEGLGVGVVPCGARIAIRATPLPNPPPPPGRLRPSSTGYGGREE